MTYKVVPFTARITQKDTSTTVSEQVQQIIDLHAKQGWQYVSLESVQTSVAPSAGCFGLGATPGFTTSFQMLVFQQ